MSLNVVQMVASLDVGGLERYVIELTANFPESVTSTIFCLSHEGTLFNEVAKGTQTEVGHRAVYDSFLHIPTLRQLIRYIKDHEVDVLHCHNRKAYLYGYLASRWTGCPLVLSTHGIIYGPSRRKIVEGITMRGARRIISVSNEITDELISTYNLPPQRLVTLRNGIDTRRFSPCTVEQKQLMRSRLGLPENAYVFGTLGRVVTDKNYGLLVRAFSNLASKFDQAHLVIVGDGDKLEEIRKLVDSLELKERVSLPGAQTDTLAWYQAFDAFVLSSLTEGTPMTLLEAGACALPCVSTSVGGIPQVIEQGKNGILVDSGDEAALSTALSDLLTDSDLATALGNAGRDIIIQKFSLEKSIEEHIQVYSDAMNS